MVHQVVLLDLQILEAHHLETLLQVGSLPFLLEAVALQLRQPAHSVPTGSPRPAGLLMPGPDAKEGGAAPPGALVPSLADGSAGGGPSTEHEMMRVPRTMVKPNVLFSSVSMAVGAVAAPGADGVAFVGFLFTRRNSSVSARTRFMCLTISVQHSCLLPCS